MKKLLILGVLILAGILLIANYQDIYKSVIPPNPEIINKSADGSSSRIFNYSIKVKGEVRNTGGDGFVIVKATAMQEGNKWERTQKIFLLSYEAETFEFIFDEVKLLDKDPTYDVETYALGSLLHN